MRKRVLMLNGPNLNLMGERQKDIYREVTLEDVNRRCQELANELGLEVRFVQSNFEGAMVELKHEARKYAHVTAGFGVEGYELALRRMGSPLP